MIADECCCSGQGEDPGTECALQASQQMVVRLTEMMHTKQSDRVCSALFPCFSWHSQQAEASLELIHQGLNVHHSAHLGSCELDTTISHGWLA